MAAPMDTLSDHLSSVRHVILILSGKGGVGKSTVATQIALGLKHAGKKGRASKQFNSTHVGSVSALLGSIMQSDPILHVLMGGGPGWCIYTRFAKVGLLDVDLCGPSVPKMFGVQEQDVHQCPEGWLPVYVDKEQQLGIMSISFLLGDHSDAVVWRGPKKNAMIKQFLSDVVWRNVDYLVIDTPPGTSDEHISVVESLKRYNPDGAILVTTPQAVAVGDVRRELTFCRKTGVPVIGIIENMSGFACPCCGEITNIFSKGGGESLAQQNKVPFLGCIPIDPQLAAALEEGKDFQSSVSQSPSLSALNNVVLKLLLIDKDFP